MPHNLDLLISIGTDRHAYDREPEFHNFLRLFTVKLNFVQERWMDCSRSWDWQQRNTPQHSWTVICYSS